MFAGFGSEKNKVETFSYGKWNVFKEENYRCIVVATYSPKGAVGLTVGKWEYKNLVLPLVDISSYSSFLETQVLKKYKKYNLKVWLSSFIFKDS